MNTLPEVIENETALDNLLTTPSPELVESVRRIPGDVMVLGVGGKMGPTLAILLRRALEEAGSRARVIGVSRFSGPGLRERLHARGVETIPCDLLDPAQLATLPHADTVIYLVGMKFGSTGAENLTWAMNTYLPGMVAQHFAGARMVALSTGN
ncbi:MAG TPA: epimerase, partial [Candidatus Latescibacteria bacterium]|nr:epimerase [Candidatus Latescibacterota bacterium]